MGYNKILRKKSFYEELRSIYNNQGKKKKKNMDSGRLQQSSK